MPIPSRTLAVLVASAVAAFAGCTTTSRGSNDGSGMYGTTYGPAPQLDPGRKISEQDCTKRVVRDGGNLLCK